MSISDEHQKDSIITFVKNTDPASARFSGDEPVLTMPYSKIIEASMFCERERLDFVYLGFKGLGWQCQISKDDLEYYIVVTQNGLSIETTKEYAYVITQPPSL